ncbi:MAG: hypothetical protein OMM_15321, partial [Candidatus Magnetoglobus multicellularis str. Araruama]
RQWGGFLKEAITKKADARLFTDPDQQYAKDVGMPFLVKTFWVLYNHQGGKHLTAFAAMVKRSELVGELFDYCLTLSRIFIPIITPNRFFAQNG